jgi:hypothetical protein
MAAAARSSAANSASTVVPVAAAAAALLAAVTAEPAATVAASNAPPPAPNADIAANPTTATPGIALPTPRGPARVALVIGNQSYTAVPSLRNSRADAEAMAAALDNLGFEVLLRTDLDDRSLRQAMRDFKGRLDGGSEAVFYFAGHGVQLGAANYLLPTKYHRRERRTGQR